MRNTNRRSVARVLRIESIFLDALSPAMRPRFAPGTDTPVAIRKSDALASASRNGRRTFRILQSERISPSKSPTTQRRNTATIANQNTMPTRDAIGAVLVTFPIPLAGNSARFPIAVGMRPLFLATTALAALVFAETCGRETDVTCAPQDTTHRATAGLVRSRRCSLRIPSVTSSAMRFHALN